MKNKFEVTDEEVVIYLNSKKGVVKALIDKTDFKLVSSFPNYWRAQEYKSGYYAVGQYTLNGKRVAVFMHRLILGEPKGYVVDHIDRNTLNNKRNNLRPVSVSQNCSNQKVRKNSASGIKGVSKHKKADKWVVRVGGVYLGIYSDLEEATEVARKAYPTYLPFYVE